MTIKKFAGLAAAAALVFAGCGAGGTEAESGSNVRTEAKAPAKLQKSQATDYQAAVQQLYVAYFGRPADPGGLTNFSSALQAAGAPADIPGLMAAYGGNAAVKQLVDSFGTSTESLNLYGSGNTNDFVTAVFQNVLGRAPQASGLAYWSSAIDSGSLTRGDAALAIMGGALANTTDQGKLDAQLIQNRLTVAAQFTTELQAQGVSSSYAGAAAASSARALLGAVSSATGLVAYQGVVVSTVSSLAVSGGKSVLEPFVGIVDDKGSTDGVAAFSSFSSPEGVARAANGDLFVADRLNQTIRKVSHGIVSTFAGAAGISGNADGTGAAARFNMPSSVAIDNAGNLYVADAANDTIRKISQAGVVTTVAGIAGHAGSVDGPVASALLDFPLALTVDGAGNIYTFANCAVRKITPGGVVSTLAGKAEQCGDVDGVGAAAEVTGGNGITSDGSGNVYVTANYSYTIRKITPDGTVTTIAGQSGQQGTVDANGTNARFTGPQGIYCDSSGNLYVTDSAPPSLTLTPPSSLVRKIAPNGDVTTYPGAVNITTGAGIAADSAGNVYFTAPEGDSGFVEMMSPGGVTTLLAGQPWSYAPVDGQGAAATFSPFLSIAQDTNGNLFAIDGSKFRKISPSGAVTTLVDAAPAFLSAQFMAFDTSGNAYVTDTFHRKIWKISPDGTVSLFAGSGATGRQDGTGSGATFLYPRGIAFDGKGTFYVADFFSIRKVTTAGVVTTLATYSGDTSVTPDFAGIALDPSGNVFVSDSARDAIYKVTPSGQLSLVAGTSTSVAAVELATLGGSSDGTGSQASFNGPTGLVLDSSGNLYVADYNNSAIRKVTPQGIVSTIAGVPGEAAFVPGVLPSARLADPRNLVLQGRTLYISGVEGVAALYNLP